MINKRLVGSVPDSKKYTVLSVLFKWLSLCANIALMSTISVLLAALFAGTASGDMICVTACVAAAAIIVRFVCTRAEVKMSYLSSRAVKKLLREKIFKKLLRLGASYTENVKTSEVIQMAVEGVDQLDTYFGAYLPQFFYAVLAPFTLFIYFCFVNVWAGLVLLICVPLIPVAIAAVQTWAKKLLSKYWGQYTALGDTFLENLQGLTTLKIYRSDEFKNDEMNAEAEKFRRITMKVLTMQLNSVTIMDLIAYGGAALGIIMAATQYASGGVSLAGALTIILLSADFFIPMRRLGSYFHVAMNGMAACDKIFNLLDLPEPEAAEEKFRKGNIICENLSFSYEADREVLHGINLTVKSGSFTSIVGKSGCGKSTVAAILTGQNKGFSGSVTVGGVPLEKISEAELMKNITYVGSQSYLFKGTVRDNLLMGKPDATDAQLWNTLDRVKLSDFLHGENGLDTELLQRGDNLSGGQRQRLALARAVLHNSEVYIFDEATSNVDVESENDIMSEIHSLAKTKTVVLISHRLANVTDSDIIYVMNGGTVAESGTHAELLERNGEYARLYGAQSELENYAKGGGKQ